MKTLGSTETASKNLTHWRIKVFKDPSPKTNNRQPSNDMRITYTDFLQVGKAYNNYILFEI